jgi:hypothetical protein
VKGFCELRGGWRALSKWRRANTPPSVVVVVVDKNQNESSQFPRSAEIWQRASLLLVNTLPSHHIT